MTTCLDPPMQWGRPRVPLYMNSIYCLFIIHSQCCRVPTLTSYECYKFVTFSPSFLIFFSIWNFLNLQSYKFVTFLLLLQICNFFVTFNIWDLNPAASTQFQIKLYQVKLKRFRQVDSVKLNACFIHRVSEWQMQCWSFQHKHQLLNDLPSLLKCEKQQF